MGVTITAEYIGTDYLFITFINVSPSLFVNNLFLSTSMKLSPCPQGDFFSIRVPSSKTMPEFGGTKIYDPTISYLFIKIGTLSSYLSITLIEVEAVPIVFPFRLNTCKVIWDFPT